MTYQTLEPKREQILQRKPPSRFAKFMVMTSVLAALGGTPSNAVAFGVEGAVIKTEVQPTPEQKKGREWMTAGLIAGAVLAVLIGIKNRQGRPCGPWGMDLKEWNKHLAEMKRRNEGKEIKGKDGQEPKASSQ